MSVELSLRGRRDKFLTRESADAAVLSPKHPFITCEIYYLTVIIILMRLTKKLNELLRSVVVALAVLVAFAPAGAQGLTSVTGTVTDSEGEPLIGATVREKGTSNVTATDIDGNFTLKLASARPTVEVSYIGYEPVKVRVTQSPLKIQMKASESELDEVVVVAYGVQKKATVTGSIATVDSKEITKSSAPNVAAALAGKLPGLTTIQTNGAPGKDEVEMYLRGAATSNETKPLILVDGIPRETIREIDANEIETISVLKDASATAVFGVRGANGVILITTKRGQKGTMKVNATVRYSLQSFAREAYHRPSYDYARLLNEARANEGIAPEYQDYELALYDMWANGGNGPSDPELAYWYPNTDWSDIYFKDNSSMVQANVNVSGGTDKLQYFVNAGYVYQGGMYKTEDSKTLGYDPQAKMNRYNLRANIDYQFSSWVKASIDVSSFIEKVNGTNGNEPAVWGDAITARTTAPYPLTPAGQYVRGDGTDAAGNAILNPVRPGQIVLDPVQTLQSGYGNMNRSGYNLDTRSGVNAIATLNVDLGKLTEGLSLRGVVSFESRGNNTNTALKGFTTYKFERSPAGLKDPSDPTKDYVLNLPDGITTSTGSTTIPHPVFTFDGDNEEDGRLSLHRRTSSWWFLNMQVQANYNRTFNKLHAVTGMVMFQRDIRENDKGEIPFNMIGLSARATYAFDSRYLAEVNIGYNGTEQFAPGRRFGFFPAFSAGWVVSNEKFMESLRYNNLITKLKLRASVGKVGNDGLKDEPNANTRFLYLDRIDHAYHTSHIPSLGNGGKIEIRMLGNPDIHWETAWKQNYAVDLTLFNNLDLTFDYYIENRSDILIARNTVPVISGLTRIQVPRLNMGKVKNQGYEISANYRIPIRKDFWVSVGGNFAYNTNKVIEADEAILSEDYAYRYRTTGFMLGQNWGYIVDRSVNPATGQDGSGFFNSDEQIKAMGLTYETGGGLPQPGDFIYKDLNGDGVINDRDRAPIGYSSMLPKINYGISLSAQFKGFDLSVMFQGTGKYSKYYSGRGIFEEEGSKYFPDMVENRWSKDRYAAGLPIDHPRLANSGSVSHVQNDYYTMDASYTRLKNAEIGYTIPASVCRKAGLESVRVYASGDNIYTWQHLHTKSFDPEQKSILDYPLMRTWSFGLNVSF